MAMQIAKAPDIWMLPWIFIITQGLVCWWKIEKGE